MRVSRWAWSVALLLVGCGGSAPAPAAPPVAPEAAPAPAAAAPEAAPDKPSGDGWEGEGDAKSGATSNAGKPAAAVADNGAKETRTVEVVAKMVKEHRPAVRACYEKAQKEIPSLQGDLVIHFVLDPAGKVKTIELNQERSTLKSPPVTDCAIREVKSIAFPPSSRGMETNVNYPFNFMPGGPPPH